MDEDARKNGLELASSASLGCLLLNMDIPGKKFHMLGHKAADNEGFCLNCAGF